MLHKTVSKEQAFRAVIEMELTELRSSVSAYDVLVARLAELDKSLAATRAEVDYLKEQVARADTYEADSDKHVPQILEESEQRTVHLIVALVVRNHVEKVTR